MEFVFNRVDWYMREYGDSSDLELHIVIQKPESTKTENITPHLAHTPRKIYLMDPNMIRFPLQWMKTLSF